MVDIGDTVDIIDIVYIIDTVDIIEIVHAFVMVDLVDIVVGIVLWPNAVFGGVPAAICILTMAMTVLILIGVFGSGP